MKKVALLNLLLLQVIYCNNLHSQNICIDVSHNNVENNGRNGTFDKIRTWENGKNINVKFLNGSIYLQEKVKKYALEWTKYANIDFQFIESGYSDIRIYFDNSGSSWSYIGRDAESISQNYRTMNFGWFDQNSTEEEFRRTILHEFGHALGLLHEHQNPNANFIWNKPFVYAYYMQRLGWTKEMVENNIFGRYSVAHSNGHYDSQSIMHYPVPREFILSGNSVGWNTNLSQMDKKFITSLYPQKETSVVVDKEVLKLDYKMTNIYEFGGGQKRFILQFSECSDECIYMYSDNENMEISLVNDAYEIYHVNDPSKYDRSSRVRTVYEGEILIVKNQFGFYAAVKVIDIKCKGRGFDNEYTVLFEYQIFKEPIISTWQYNPSKYISRSRSGTITFDYSNNNGRFLLGDTNELFETVWSGCNSDCIRLFTYNNKIPGHKVAKVNRYSPSKNYYRNVIYDDRNIIELEIGDLGLLRNESGEIVIIELIGVTYKGRNNAKKDIVKFAYQILE